MDNQTELKPCPFCGGKAKQLSGGLLKSLVICTSCGCQTMPYYNTIDYYGKTKSAEEKATYTWNRRASHE